MPRWGAWRLAGPAASPGARFCGLSNMISDMIAEHRPAFVLKEAPLNFGAKSSMLVRRSQYGLHGCAEEACYRAEAHLVEEGADVIRKAIIGRHRWKNPDGSGADPKVHVMAWCNAHGYAVHQPDAADAIVAWLYACANLASLMPRKMAA